MKDFKKRKKYIKINCSIIMGLFIAVFLLMGFPIISNASQVSMNDYDPDWKQKLISSDGYLSVNPNADSETCASSYLSSGYNSLLSFDDLIINWNDNFNSDFSIDDYQLVYMEIKNDNEVNLHCFIPDLNSYPNMKLSLIGLKNGSFSPYVINSDGAYNWHGGRPAYFVDCKYSLNTSTGEFDWVSRTWNSSYADYESYNYGYMNSLKNGFGICYANCPIKSVKYVPGVHSNNVADIYFNHDFIDINYNLNYEPISTYSDGSGGNDSNNLYMRTADFKFNIPKYWGNVTSVYTQSQYTSQWGNGNVIFYGLLNDYQIANASNFTLMFNFHIWCSGHYFSSTNSSINGNFYGSYNFNNASTPLSSFIENDCTWTWKVSDIFYNAINSNGDRFSGFIDDHKSHEAIDNWNWYMTCDVSLVSNGESSGHITEKYNFISQVSEETGNDITTNSNPYIPPSDSGFNPDVNNPNSDNGSSTTTTGNGNITINNNNNFNPNNTNNVSNEMGGSVLPNLMNILSQGQSSSVSEMQNITNSNGWLNVMKSTYNFIPSSIWVSLGVYFVTALGILIVGFVLSIVIKFIT